MSNADTMPSTDMLLLIRACQQNWTRLRGRVKDEKAAHINRREMLENVAEYVHGYLGDDRRVIHTFFDDSAITADVDGSMRALLVLTRSRSLKSKYVELLTSIIRAFGQLEHQVFDRDFAPPPSQLPTQHVPAGPPSASGGDKVFVVHGHDEAAKQGVARFLEHLGLRPIILHEQANQGRTIIEKVELDSDVRFAVILLTPDDIGAAQRNSGSLNPRARQNVVFEWGFLIAKLSRRNVCALRVNGVELPSDLQGVVYTDLDNRGAWRTELARELRSANINIDMNRLV